MRPEVGHWRTFDVTDGLAGLMVNGITQDRDGHLWFATMNNGVSCYDGRVWCPTRVKMVSLVKWSGLFIRKEVDACGRRGRLGF